MDVRVLLVDANRETLLALKEKLAGSGYQVDAVMDRHGVKDSLAKGVPDLVLLDADEDREQVMELVAQLKDQFEFLPTIVLVTDADASLVADGIPQEEHDISFQADLRYSGQAFQITVDFTSAELESRGLPVAAMARETTNTLFTYETPDTLGADRWLGALVGGVLGGAAGNAAEKAKKKKPGWELIILLDNGEEVGVQVPMNKRNRAIYKPGDRVRMMSGPNGQTKVTKVK